MGQVQNLGEKWLNPGAGRTLFEIFDDGSGLAVAGIRLFDGNGCVPLAIIGPAGSPYNLGPYFVGAIVTTGASNFTVVLPPAALVGPGRRFLIMKADAGAGAVVVTASGNDTIEGASSKSIPSQYNKAGFVSDGAGTWYDLGTGGV